VAKIIGRSLQYLRRVFQTTASFAAKQPKVLDPVILTQPAMHGCYHTLSEVGGALGLKFLSVQGAVNDPRVELWTSGAAERTARDHVRYILGGELFHNDGTARRLLLIMEDINGNFPTNLASRDVAGANQRLHLPFGVPIPGADTQQSTSVGYRLTAQVSGALAGGRITISGYFVDVWRGDLPPFG